MPSALVLVEDDKARVLLLHRADDGEWCMPGGGAEAGSSFIETALTELREESGIAAQAEHLQPFASISAADIHTLTYPNGDVTHYFALVFALTGLDSATTMVTCDDESVDYGFFDRGSLPEPLAAPARKALDLYDAFVRSGNFQPG